MGNEITIVSGLPRSGTSMMMRMLEAGGMDVFADHLREPDIDNPDGYYEYEKVKNIKEDYKWLDDLHGKAIKVVSMLLYALPTDKNYKIIFMIRNMEEILASQRAMLERKGKVSDFSAEDMKQVFTKHLEEIKRWLSKQRNMDILFINYNEVISIPHECVKKINEFLDDKLNSMDMLRVVNKSLYRQRSGRLEESPSMPDVSKEDTDQVVNEQERKKIEDQLRGLGYM